MKPYMHPIEFLPISKPLTDPNPPDEKFFYDNVVKPILPYIIEMESNGIPIDIKKVKEIEEITDQVLSEVQLKLDANPVIQAFLAQKSRDYRNNQQVQKKSLEDYLVPFNRKNTQHRTYVVNAYLKEHDKEADCLPKWSIRDLKLYASMTGSKFLQDIAEDSITPSTRASIDRYMRQMAQDKADIYNANVKAKIEDKAKEIRFNPGSSAQKRSLFEFLGIESEGKTDKGQEQWNRKQLEVLKQKLESEIELS